MESITTICVFLVMFGTGQTNAHSKPEICNHGDNATVTIEHIPAGERKIFEINFSSFTKKQHDINMFIILQNTTNENYVQFSKSYYGRINDVKMNNGKITFILLNVNVMDSGNYTVIEGKMEKGKRSIFVTRRILNGQVTKPMILSFMCNNTNTSSIKIRKSHAFDYVDYIIFDVERKYCTYTNVSQDYKDRNFSCVLNDANFDLTFRDLIWSDKGAYIAWDDMGLLLDALFLGIPGHIQSPPDTKWPLISSAVIVLVAAVLAILTVRKIRGRQVPKTTINNLTDRNGNQNTVDITRNRHFEEATSVEASARILTKVNNEDDPADLTNNKSHEKVKSKDRHYHARGLYSKSPRRTSNKHHMHSSVSSDEDFQSETTHGYNSTRKCAKLKTECPSDKLHLCSTKSIAGPSFEYDYVVQGSWKTSRARAPDPVATKQKNGIGITDDSISWHRKEEKTSSSRVDPSTSYARVNRKRTKKNTHCTDYSAEQGSRDLNIELTSPCSFEFKSGALVKKSRGEPPMFNYELAKDVSDDSSSCYVSNENLMVDSSVRPSRKSSVRKFMDDDCYYSLYGFCFKRLLYKQNLP
ncbi:hypothetical protein ACJMK2_024871 [Sinanodonta woodiana]|uniref:Uncharacterized protein n=1 Tax=Sinanodonta woodiana TaxID=1069815 RepID=A0ABD3XIC8_SINWO